MNYTNQKIIFISIFLSLLLIGCNDINKKEDKQLFEKNIVETKYERKNTKKSEIFQKNISLNKSVQNIKTSTSLIVAKELEWKKIEDIFWDIKIGQKVWEVNFRITWKLEWYVDKIEISWVNDWINKWNFFITEKWAFEPEWYWWKKNWYDLFRYKFRWFNNVDLWENEYVFKAYLNNEIISEKEFSYKAKTCWEKYNSLKDLYDNKNWDINIKSLRIIEDNYFSVVSKKLDPDNIELFLEKINCISWKREILFENIWPDMIRWIWDFIYHDIRIHWMFNNKLLFSHVWTKKESSYSYDNVSFKLKKLENSNNINDIRIWEGWIFYKSLSLGDNKLILLDNSNNEKVLYKDDWDKFWVFENMPEWFFVLKWYELLESWKIKILLLKWNNTDSPEESEIVKEY